MIFMLSEDGVSVKSALSESALKWAIYARATESGSGFALFYQGSRMFNWLSKSGFSNEDEIKRCRELLRQKVKDSKKLFVY